jgi:hypothetical protein
MPEYYAFILDGHDRVVGRRVVTATAEGTAVDAACKAIFDAMPGCPAIEVWDGPRMMRRIERPAE